MADLREHADARSVSAMATLRSIVAHQVAAAEARDHDAFIAATKAYFAESFGPRKGVPIRGSEWTDRYLGAAIIAGKGASLASVIRSNMSRQSHGVEIALGAVPEEDWSATEMRLLRDLRLLESDWRGLPSMPSRHDLAILYPSDRKKIRDSHAFLDAMSRRDAAGAAKAIGTIGRAEKSRFSLMAYALYAKARAAGLDVKVPRKYDF